MELTVASIITNLLVLLFRHGAYLDTNSFFPGVHFSFFQTFSEFFPTTWNTILGRKLEFSNTSGPIQQAPSCNKETCGVENKIHIREINVVMNRLGMVGGLEEDDGSKSILGADDFLALFEEEEPSLEEIKETFGVFDVNKDGFIDGSELQTVLCSLGLEFRLEECKRMIVAFDGNGDGLIDFQDFLKFMERCLC
ncbi:probable calcium-binding protein CML45 [Sesamum indicum]|uniref:Probable calcium-binding protein CML45 n=1 Tax=Sesamum indicum TaxID=4182 RepID=A0A6I9SMS0_SESIN|nr:probable calcium-binding protein CML45 [Sesamum indicum]